MRYNAVAAARNWRMPRDSFISDLIVLTHFNIESRSDAGEENGGVTETREKSRFMEIFSQYKIRHLNEQTNRSFFDASLIPNIFISIRDLRQRLFLTFYRRDFAREIKFFSRVDFVGFRNCKGKLPTFSQPSRHIFD